MFVFGSSLVPGFVPPIVLRSLALAGFGVGLCPLLALGHGAVSERIAQEIQQCAGHPDDPVAHFKLADLYVEHEEWEKAVTEIDRVEQLAPGQYPTDYLRGSALLLAQKPSDALQALDRFLAQHPTNPLGHLQRARTYRALNRIESSTQDFRLALQYSRSPEPDLILEAANAEAAAGAIPEALVILERGLTQLGSIPSLTLRALELETATGRYDAALARLANFQKTAPRPEPWMAKRADLLAQAGRIDEARAAWQTLIAHLDALPNLERGSHAMSMLSEKARQALKALPVASPPPVVTVETGNANYDEELERADAEIARQPGEAVHYFRRAEFHRLARHWAKARADCDTGDRLAPGKFPMDRIRGEALAGEGRLADAHALLTRFLERQPNDGPALAVRARVELGLKQTDAALQDFQRSLTVTIDAPPDFFQEVAGAFRSAGQDEMAAEILAAGLTKYPDAPSLISQDLELKVARGKVDAALSQIDSLMQGSPRPELWVVRRARLLEAAGRRVEARAAWQALLDRIAARPNLERGAPDLAALARDAQAALATTLADSSLLSRPSDHTHTSLP